jgi:hypothetical protein
MAWVVSPDEIGVLSNLKTWRTRVNEIAASTLLPEEMWEGIIPKLISSPTYQRMLDTQMQLININNSGECKKQPVPAKEDVERLEKWRSTLTYIATTQLVNEQLTQYQLVVPAERCLKRGANEKNKAELWSPIGIKNIRGNGKDRMGLFGTDRLAELPLLIVLNARNISLDRKEVGTYPYYKSTPLTGFWAENTPLGLALAIRAKNFQPEGSTLLLIEFRHSDLAIINRSKQEELEQVILFFCVVSTVLNKHRKNGQTVVILAPPKHYASLAETLWEVSRWRLRAKYIMLASYLFGIPAYPLWTTGVARPDGHVAIMREHDEEEEMYTKSGKYTIKHGVRMNELLRRLDTVVKPFQKNTVWPKPPPAVKKTAPPPPEVVVVE